MPNYRPISRTSVVGKLLESIRARNTREHGFMKGKSCLTNLLTFYRKVYEAADKDENYDVIYLDFSKAFDKVPHQRLLHKVRAHGIGGKVYK